MAADYCWQQSGACYIQKSQFASASKNKRHRFCMHCVPFIQTNILFIGSCINTKPKSKISACFVKKTLFSFVQKDLQIFSEKREGDAGLLPKLCLSSLARTAEESNQNYPLRHGSICHICKKKR